MQRERKRPKPSNSYVALLCDIIDKEPSNYEEDTKKKEWKDSMIKEYRSIMKNDVWEIVLRSEGKFFMTSNYIHKIKHVSYGSIENNKARIVVRGFSHK